MLTGLLFSMAFSQPSRVTAGTMGPMEDVNWTMGTCICSHWLCGPLLCYWPLCGHHGCSWSVHRGGFCHLPPHPPLSVPPHLTLPIPPTPSIINTDGTLLSILMAERDGKNALKFSHQRHRRLATIKTNR